MGENAFSPIFSTHWDNFWNYTLCPVRPVIKTQEAGALFFLLCKGLQCWLGQGEKWNSVTSWCFPPGWYDTSYGHLVFHYSPPIQRLHRIVLAFVLAHLGQRSHLTLSWIPFILGTVPDVYHRRYPVNSCFKSNCPQEYNNLYMVHPHNLSAISTFSCPCSPISSSAGHSGIPKGLTPSSLDYVHLSTFLESQEPGQLYAWGGASSWCWWRGVIWVGERAGEAIWKPESPHSKCGWKTELFTDTENSFTLVHQDSLEEGMWYRKQILDSAPPPAGRPAVLCSLHHILFSRLSSCLLNWDFTDSTVFKC